jgi:hypothetical protein
MTCHACGADPSRLYQTGDCCPLHTPAAVAGRPETYADPELTAEALYEKRGIKHGFLANDSSLIDDRAVASGRRRSNPHTWKAARAAEEERKAAEKARRVR